jgi:pimeloyl-ACP methyl ester carboxylesterase
VVRQLRYSLNNSGYTTLSIENPTPADANGNGIATDFSDYVADVQGANTVFPEMHARVQASIDHFESLGVEQVVIAGFSLGSRFATEYVARGQQAGDLPVAGLLGVGMYGTSIDPLNISLTLDELSVPVLDIFGDVDFNAVNTAAARRAAYGGNAADYTQVVLDCPDNIVGRDCHALRGGLKGADDRPLETTVRNWMRQVAPLSVPEPATLSLMLLGIAGMGLRSRKQS